jgi:uncharacterized protein
MKTVRAVLAFLALAPPAAAAAALPDCPNIGLKRAPVTFVTARGRFPYTLEVAATPAQQQCGMMFRQAMPAKTGMDFPFNPPRELAFWMENTPLPLDLVFVNAESRVIGIGKGKPYSRDLIPSNGIAARVIELNAGEAARIGLKPGDRVER